MLTAYNVLAGLLALAFVVHKIHKSGETSRSNIVPAVGDLMLVSAGV